MDTNPVNLPNNSNSKYSFYFTTLLLLAIVFLFSLVIAIQSQSIQKGSQRLEQKVAEKTNINTTESVNDWNIYRNSVLEFEIQYPSGYFIQKGDSVIKISNSNEFEKNETALVITLQDLNNTNFYPTTDSEILNILDSLGYYQLAQKFNYRISGNYLGDPPWGYYQISFASQKTDAPDILITTRIHRSDQLSESEGGTKGKLANSAKQIIATFKFSEANTQEVNSKTYINSKYGFELMYPGNYFVSESNETTTMIADNKWKDELVHHPAIYLQIYATGLSVDEWVQEQIDKKIDSGYEICTIGCEMHSISEKADEVTIGGNIRALRYKEWGVSGGNTYTVVKKSANSKWLLVISDHTAGSRAPGETSVPRDIVEQMFSTFKFLN